MPPSPTASMGEPLEELGMAVGSCEELGALSPVGEDGEMEMDRTDAMDEAGEEIVALR